MRSVLPPSLLQLADRCPRPLYLVGGCVRDFLCGDPVTERSDFDICSPATEEEVIGAAKACGFTVKSVFRAMGTVKLACGGSEYEFTRFRTDEYVRGEHRPSRVVFTEDVGTDARRRDFCANAVYYELREGKLVDPLGGTDDIREKRLRTVASASKVFGEDGLRLMRLARIAAQTGFEPDGECLEGARENCALIRDVYPERIAAELMLLLCSDEKHGDRSAPYRGLCILRDTGVLKEILPELALGEGMAQRSEFHDHDVLEHSLRCAAYAPREVRLAALLHDVGKPFCFLRDGNYYAHPEEGARIAEEILTRLRFPKKITAETAALVRLHMRDYNLQMKEGKIRREIVENYPLLPKLFLVKQADFSACKDRFEPAPAVVKWQGVLQKMREEGVPFTLSQLKVRGDDLLAAGVSPEEVGKRLRELLLYCAEDGARNNRAALLKHLEKTL